MQCADAYVVEVSSSKLGTKEFWDEAFKHDLKVYKETKDVGDVWFGNVSVKRIVDWMMKSDLVSLDSSILDVGCGNGATLVKLAKNAYQTLTGIDYCSYAIELAKSIACDEGLSIHFEVCSVLDASDTADDSKSCGSCTGQSYDVVLDKGTYDAICLNPDNAQIQRTKYQQAVGRLVRSNGLFIITSCNWTQAELLQHFGTDFQLHDVIPTPQFQFGGSVGKKETVLVFRRIVH